MFLDDSACNLARLNLRKFQYPRGASAGGRATSDIKAFEHAVDITILAQERSSSITRVIPPSASATTATSSDRWGSATPTSVRC